ncbi:uncharacterized protein TRAVEDRAFT_48958 [Trametes versicolor FP-101664 SS1]|uniref:uncharacterized protein n=1 Tax=Trametes versicolor (strain FP-101664) TaxID=717944 RepID=UPI000462140F|nr:uncharacterized protein TRAVEDRAFT_48958 [Trametes versicolor FP-101664 SS1]EIW57935.1 hypothetical protein TRAVEDRAFT_48958 [Trametes versicolor FP-101664 SS1]
MTSIHYPQLPAVDNTYGAVLIGAFLGLILYGVMLLQVYTCTRRQLADALYLRCYVAFIVYWNLVEHYFHLSPQAVIYLWSTNLLPISTGLAIVACQWQVTCIRPSRRSFTYYAHSFYTRRVYIFQKRFKPLVAVLAVFFLGELGLAILDTIYLYVHPNLTTYHRVARLNSAVYALAVTADTILTSVLVINLRRRRTEFRRTNSTINALIAYAVTTGLLIDMVSIVSLALAWIMPDNFIYVGCNIVSTYLYINCVLGTLNARQSLSGQHNGLSQPDGLINLSSLAQRSDTRTGSALDPTQCEEKHPNILHIETSAPHAPEQREFEMPVYPAALEV